ncbi:DNA polymerase I [Caulobacter phage CcrSC]|uniref:DNA polymerase n=1 Tax=Caulobacter phage CcrSC TaxID=2283272 RepID=A0A385EDK5_9CAUD|nr:DNA polymerase I [Caulobacter phage CcrSC]AXQ69766.1 DNA polymerase [Caulobacter phage CcrSC]
MKLRRRRLIWDIETDGLLHELTRVHVLTIRDIDTRQTFVFRRNDVMDNIRDGLKMLNEADLIVGHNIIGFDNYALWKVYGDEYNPQGTMRDTLIMSRMLYSQIKDDDFRLWKRGTLPGEYIGSHTLGAWGARLGFPKDDYAARRKTEATENWQTIWGLPDQFNNDLKAYIHWYTWANWNQDMEDYGIQDLDPTEALWLKMEKVEWSEDATILEHMICDLMARVEQNGINFDRTLALQMEAELRAEYDAKTKEAIQHFGKWFTATKWRKGEPPRPEFGEDDSRLNWGEVTVPKRSIKFKDPMSKGGDKTEGCAYCPIVLKEFNPNSRPMIVNRLETIYEWVPERFTEKNTPIVDDEVLRNLGLTIPICVELAEIFYYKKRLGQLADGAESWLHNCDAEGRIHARINPGGTVTNRASHSKPNIAQVPRVVYKKLKQWVEKDVTYRWIGGKIAYGVVKTDKRTGEEYFDQNLTPLLDPNGEQFVGVPVVDKETGQYVLDRDGTIKTKPTLLKGRAGDHGWDSRNLFMVPEGWVMMGADQKGIELRALAHFMWEFDDGEYAQILLEADIHDAHTAAMGLDSRDKAKTFIYAMIYGAQDFKLGVTIDPTLENYPTKAKALGAQMRERLMSRYPALRKLIKSVQRTAKKGYVEALDGRQLFVRAKHSALNTLLQGAGATLAKIWCVSFESFMEEAGFKHGWDGDFVILAWIHDELQVAVRDDPAVKMAAERYITEAATYSGERVNFRLPVEIDVKWGTRWSHTH